MFAFGFHKLKHQYQRIIIHNQKIVQQIVNTLLEEELERNLICWIKIVAVSNTDHQKGVLLRGVDPVLALELEVPAGYGLPHVFIIGQERLADSALRLHHLKYPDQLSRNIFKLDPHF